MRITWKAIAFAMPAVFLAACKDQPSAPLQQTHAIAADRSHDPNGGTGPFGVGFTHYVFRDASRANRPIAIAVWYPVDRASIDASASPAQYPLDIYTGTLPTATSADYEAYGLGRAYQEPPASRGRYPLVIFSAGAGDTYEQYAYVGLGLASHGIVVGILTHWGDGYSGSPGEPYDAWEEMAYNRPRDMSRALDALLARNSAPHDLLHGTIDPQRVVASGHSIGGYAAMVLAGGDDLVCDIVDPATAVPGTCVASLPDPRFGAIITLDGANAMLKFHELARVHVAAMGIGADSLRTSVALSIPPRQHAAFVGHPNYRVDVHNPVADAFAYHMAFSNVCASLGVYQRYPEMAQLWAPGFQFWLDSWCPVGALPAQEMYRIVTKYMVSFLNRDQPVLTPGYALTHPDVDFFVTEPRWESPSMYSYFIAQPGKHRSGHLIATAYKDPVPAAKAAVSASVAGNPVLGAPKVRMRGR